MTAFSLDYIQSKREEMQARILNSFNIEEHPNAKASLVKGLSDTEFKKAFPETEYEIYSFQTIEKFNDDFAKAIAEEADDLKKAEGEKSHTASLSNLQPIILQNGVNKRLMYVRKKATA